MLAAIEAVFLVAILVIFSRHVSYFDFVCDDAFISFRYAKNLVTHGELVYNIGERIEGYTNFLWTLLIAGGIWLGADPVHFAKTLGWFWGAGCLFLVWRVGASWIETTSYEWRELQSGHGDDDAKYSRKRQFGEQVTATTAADNFRPSFPPSQSLMAQTSSLEKQTAMMLTASLVMVAPAICALSSSYACWSSGGLETSMFTFFLSASVFLFLHEEKGINECDLSVSASDGALSSIGRFADRIDVFKKQKWSGLLFAISTLIRPEGGLFFAVSALWRGVKVFSVWQKFRHREVRKILFVYYLRWLAFYILPLLPWVLWKLWYYGEILPNTFRVKGGGIRMIRRGIRDLSFYIFETKIFLLFFPLILGWLGGLKTFARRFGGPSCGLNMNFLFIVVIIGFLYYIWIGGDFMMLARFLVPVLPFCALMAQEGVLLLFEIAGAGRSMTGGRGRGFHSLLLKWVFLFVLLFFFALYGQFQLGASARSMTEFSFEGTDSIGYLKNAAQEWEIAGRWIADDARKNGIADKGSIATTAGGAIPYFSGLKTLDMLGINDRFISRKGLKGGDRPGHTMAAPIEYVLRRKPDYLVGHPEIYPEPKKRDGFETALMDFWGYEPRIVRLPTPDPLWFHFWFRKR